MSNIVIGKYTLESLTNGMYASPMDLFREYVQNAVDSIDSAVASEMIKKQDAQIEITVNRIEHKISIWDNGTGISTEKAERILLDIGNSEKDRVTNRGFRGIGRLAGLGYCKKLIFSTSFRGEHRKTQIVFDAKLLREKLHAKSNQTESIFDVLDAVTEVSYLEEKEKSHYFLVELQDVDTDSNLLKEEEVKSYFVQNFPLEYKPSFHWGTIINKKIESEGYSIPSYSIFFSNGESKEQLYKTYDNSFVSDRVKKYVKNIDDIEIVPFLLDEKIIAILWYAKLEYAGTILDEQIKGIRIRQGNILIGDKNTANKFFKEDRFNGWLLGELFILGDDLIPNARRDDFEETPEYLALKNELLDWSTGISKEIRRMSLERSNSTEKKNTIERVVEDSDENGLEIEDLSFADEDDAINGEYDETAIIAENELFDKFQVLLGQKNNNYKYKVLNLREDIPHEQRRILEKVLNTLYDNYPKKKAEPLAECIIRNYRS